MPESADVFYVTDTSVFVDVLAVGIEEGFFGLRLIVTTDFIVRESRRNPTCHEMLLRRQAAGQLDVRPLDADQLMAVEALTIERPGLSPYDCSVYVLARALPGQLLTGDAALRKYALSQNVETHGLLYVMELLRAGGWCAAGEACDYLERWAEVNARAPVGLIDDYCLAWR